MSSVHTHPTADFPFREAVARRSPVRALLIATAFSALTWAVYVGALASLPWLVGRVDLSFDPSVITVAALLLVPLPLLLGQGHFAARTARAGDPGRYTTARGAGVAALAAGVVASVGGWALTPADGRILAVVVPACMALAAAGAVYVSSPRTAVAGL